MQLANLFWQTAREGRDPSSKKGFVKTELHIEKDGRRHGLQKVVLGMLVHYPDLLDEKGDSVSRVDFSPALEGFRQALYDLLIMTAEISVQLIYARLTPAFYEMLQDLHGERSANRPWGHRLFQRFPIVKYDPPHDFVSRCIDHLVEVLRMGQVADEIDLLKNSSDSDEASMRLLELVRDYQVQIALVNSNDSSLAEEAKEIRRVALGSVEWGVAEMAA
jgi:DNA primase